jgi:hypothetical protein
MVIDQTVTLGNLIEITAILGGGVVALITLRGTVINLKNDMTDMKAEIKKVGEVLTTLAVTSNRLDRAEQDIWELKHGEGFVLPLQRSKIP